MNRRDCLQLMHIFAGCGKWRELPGTNAENCVARITRIAWHELRELRGTNDENCVARIARIAWHEWRELRGMNDENCVARMMRIAWHEWRELRGTNDAKCVTRMMRIAWQEWCELRGTNYENCVARIMWIVWQNSPQYLLEYLQRFWCERSISTTRLVGTDRSAWKINFNFSFSSDECTVNVPRNEDFQSKNATPTQYWEGWLRSKHRWEGLSVPPWWDVRVEGDDGDDWMGQTEDLFTPLAVDWRLTSS